MSEKKNIEFEKEKLRLEYLFEHGIDLEGRIIRLSGTIDEESFEAFDYQLSELERLNPRKTITIRINSPGGSVYDALAIVGRIRSSTCPIITEGYGQIMSAAVLVLAAGKKRKMSNYAWFMHHQSSYVVAGSHDDVVDEVQQMEREERMWCKWMSELSSKTEKFWTTAAKKKNFYATAEECVKMGIIDETI